MDATRTDSTTEQENEPTATDASQDGFQRASNEPMAESEEKSLEETETALAGKASEPPSTADDPILDVDLDLRPIAKPSSEETTLREDMTSMAMNPSSTLDEEVETDAVGQPTRDSGKCDYSVGEWVLDETRSLYSGLECKLWLAPGFACRRHNHPDKLMDRYRWQPAGCDLPEFNASAVLHL